MVAVLIFNLASGILLAVMAYVFWFGVGSQRREVGRGIGIFCAGLSAYLLWQAFDLIF